MDQPKADILVVDDTPANIQILSSMLKDAGYKVRAAPDGKLAIRAVEAVPPDLILLDINMPEMDGYETCRHLKADPAHADIPVIFLSALTDTEDKVKAFASGGVDYVIKPFQFEEVRARVETHLHISRMRRQLEAQFKELQELEIMRDSLTHMIVHDLRSPLSGILTSLQLLEMDADKLQPESAEDVQRAARSAKSLMQMINALLDVNKMESGEMVLHYEDGNLVATAREAVEYLGGLVKGHSMTLNGGDADVVPARYDTDLVTRVIVNLVGNALKFAGEEGAVSVHVAASDGVSRVEVRDTGPGIPEEYRERIFEKFGQIEGDGRRRKLSTGLGLTFCKLAVEAHGGRIGVDSVVGDGSTFWFELPAAPAEASGAGAQS